MAFYENKLFWLFIFVVFVVVMFSLRSFYVWVQPHHEWTVVSQHLWNKKIKNLTGPSSVVNKKRIALICYDNRQSDPKVLAFKDINEQYCQKQGYTFLFYNSYSPDDQQYPPYWLKVKILYDLIMTDQYDYLMWIDSDACIHNPEIKIENLFNFDPEAVFVASPDPLTIFNAGVWVVKNNTLGRELMSDWIKMYDPSKWTKTASGKWSCQGMWGGIDYEQGSGRRLLLTPKYSPWVLFLPFKTLQYYRGNANSFTLHFMGELKERINHYLNEKNKALSLASQSTQKIN